MLLRVGHSEGKTMVELVEAAIKWLIIHKKKVPRDRRGTCNPELNG